MDELKEEPLIIPPWEGSVFQKWSYNFCLANAWRVRDKLGDFEDCMGQCALYYLECQEFYSRPEHKSKVSSLAHFMFRFKLWVAGQFHDLSTKDYRNRCTKLIVATRRDFTEKSDANLAVSLREASSELKEVLNILFNAPQEVLEAIKKDAKTVHSGKFFRYIVQFCGFPTTEVEIQLWVCLKCKTTRKWGEGKPEWLGCKRLKCYSCHRITSHKFFQVYKADRFAAELKNLLS